MDRSLIKIIRLWADDVIKLKVNVKHATFGSQCVCKYCKESEFKKIINRKRD